MSELFSKNLRVEYLRDIGILEPLQRKIEGIYEIFRKLCPDTIIDMFINDYIDEDGTRRYEHLRFFSEKHVMSAMNFVTEEDLRIGPIKRQIRLIRIQKKDYDLQNATEQSRLIVIVEYNGTLSTLKACKRNCDYLRDIVRKFIVPNLKE